MTHFHNTLYLSQPRTVLGCRGRALVVRQNSREKASVPVHHLAMVTCLGPVYITPAAIDLCLTQGVGINYLTPYGRFLGRITGPVRGNVLLRRAQFRLVEAGRPGLVANLLGGKIHNSRRLLMRAARNYPETAPLLDPAIRRLGQLQSGLGGPGDQDHGNGADIDRLRGIEGVAAHIFFGAYPHLIRSPEFHFNGRNRRPPRDPVNAMLSFGYTLLAGECRHALEAVGLDPYMGFLHVLRPGRAALALDLMEEFRAVKVDKMVLALINRRQCSPSDFLIHPNGAVEMKESFRKTFLTTWQERRSRSLDHPLLKQKTDGATVVHLQAQILARYIRGDLDFYTPFLAT